MWRGSTVFLAVLFVLAIGPAGLRAENTPWAEEMFEETKIDFGVVATGSDVVHRLRFKNKYKETLHISNVRTTCGCSSASAPQKTIKSLETAYIEVRLNTVKFTGQKSSNVIVTFDAPYPAEVRFPITAYIRTDVVINPGKASFGTVDHKTSANRTLDVAYAGRNNWRIVGVKTGSEHLTASVAETRRQAGRVNYDLTVTVEPSAPLGAIRQRILLVTNDRKSPHVPLLVEGRVEADVMVATPNVALGTLTPGRDKTVRVVFRGRKPFEISKVECESDRECFKVRLPRSANTVHVLPITVTPPDEPGSFSEQFIVTIAGRDEPLTFKAQGRIVK